MVEENAANRFGSLVRGILQQRLHRFARPAVAEVADHENLAQQGFPIARDLPDREGDEFVVGVAEPPWRLLVIPGLHGFQHDLRTIAQQHLDRMFAP